MSNKTSNTFELNKQTDKSHQERLFKNFDHSISTDKCKNEMENHQETVFLYLQSFGNHRENTFHHLKSIGGNICGDREIMGFHQGVKENATCIMTPDLNVLKALPNATAKPIPTTAHLLAVSSIEEVNSLMTFCDS